MSQKQHGLDQKLGSILANKQFEIIKANIFYEDLPEDGFLKIGKKRVYWWNYYFFTEDQYKEWKEWCMEKLRKEKKEQYFDLYDMIYGLIVKGS